MLLILLIVGSSYKLFSNATHYHIILTIIYSPAIAVGSPAIIKKIVPIPVVTTAPQEEVNNDKKGEKKEMKDIEGKIRLWGEGELWSPKVWPDYQI